MQWVFSFQNSCQPPVKQSGVIIYFVATVGFGKAAWEKVLESKLLGEPFSDFPADAQKRELPDEVS